MNVGDLLNYLVENYQYWPCSGIFSISGDRVIFEGSSLIVQNLFFTFHLLMWRSNIYLPNANKLNSCYCMRLARVQINSYVNKWKGYKLRTHSRLLVLIGTFEEARSVFVIRSPHARVSLRTTHLVKLSLIFSFIDEVWLNLQKKGAQKLSLYPDPDSVSIVMDETNLSEVSTFMLLITSTLTLMHYSLQFLLKVESKEALNFPLNREKRLCGLSFKLHLKVTNY